MATSKGHRVGIWIIAVVLTVGTIGSFAVMVLANNNAQQDQQRLIEAYEEQQAEVAKQSERYYPVLAKYKDTPAKFDAEAVGDSVVKTDLKVGDGATIKEDTTYQAYYIGWNPEGTTFDSSFDASGKNLSAPLDTSEIGSLIEGWEQGVVGMKVGGVRQLTIPSDLAYGSASRGADIPADTPLKFIIYIISAN